jgi:hypothetical protein
MCVLFLNRQRFHGCLVSLFQELARIVAKLQFVYLLLLAADSACLPKGLSCRAKTNNPSRCLYYRGSQTGSGDPYLLWALLLT